MEPPELPSGLKLTAAGRLLVSLAGGKRLSIPIVRLREGRREAIERLVASRSDAHVVLAPYLTRAARDALEAAGWGWIDGAGSARFRNDAVLVHIEKPGRVKKDSSVPVSPQGERVVRRLLDDYPRAYRMSELARLTKLDLGYTHRIVQRLVDAGMASREPRAPVQLDYPAELFELWTNGPHRTTSDLRFVSGSPTEIVKRLFDHARAPRMALTGPIASSILAPFSSVEFVDVYVSDRRTANEVAGDLGAESVERGGNLRFLVHRDPAIVSTGSQKVGRTRLVSTTQIYRDVLRLGQGREREAADVLRRGLLRW